VESTADNTAGTGSTYGRINALNAVATAVPIPDFSLAAAPASATVVQGSQTTFGVSVAPSGGFTGQVDFSVASVLPVGTTAVFNPVSVTGAGSSSLTVTTSTATPAGTYPLTISGVSGGVTKTTMVSMVVTAVPTPDFKLSVSPTSRSVVRGKSTTYSVSVAPSGGFTGPVIFSVVSGLPAGATAVFNPTSVTTSGSTTLTVRTSSSTTPATYTLTIKGTSGGLTRSTTVKLVVARR
jgi:hypothetical protein